MSSVLVTTNPVIRVDRNEDYITVELVEPGGLAVQYIVNTDEGVVLATDLETAASAVRGLVELIGPVDEAMAS